MKRIYITEGQFNTLLNEELGIAREVVDLSDIIEKKVYSFLDDDCDSFLDNIVNDLNISLKKYYFANMDEYYDSYYTTPKKYKNGYSKSDNTIYLTFIIIDGILCVDNIENTIQHEVEHYWQCKNKKTPLSTNHYQELVKLIDNSNPYISTIAEIIFLSKKFEIDAEINGAFAQIKNNPDIETLNDVLEKTEIGKMYDKLKRFKKSINSWDYNNYTIKYSLNVINLNNNIRGKRKKPITKDYLNKLLDKTIQYILYKTGRMLALQIEKKKLNELKNIQKKFVYLKN